MSIIKVVLDWFANTNHAGFCVAQEKGYFKDFGLEVQINGKVHGAFDAQGTDIVVAPQPSLLIAMDEGEKLCAVATLTQKCDSGILSLKECGITSPKHLEGKRLTHWTPQWFHEVLGEAVRMDGGNYEKVKLVNKDVGDIEATLGKDADAVWVYQNWEYFVMKDAGADVNYFAFADVCPLFDFAAPAVGAAQDLIDNRPHDLRNFLAALDQGYIDAARNPEQTAVLIKPYMPQVSQDLLNKSQRHLSPILLDDTGHWGTIKDSRWNRFADWMVKRGLVSQRRENEFTNAFLRKS